MAPRLHPSSAHLTFFLGAPDASWLSRQETAGVDLFVSHPRLTRVRSIMPRPAEWASYAIDSGGYTKITKYGCWPFSAERYAADITRAVDLIGMPPKFVAPMDWMCEDAALRRTGLSVEEHQRLTLESYLDLLMLNADIPWMPVLQGRTGAQFERHIDAYNAAGVALDRLDRVGVGSVCRRQNMVGASLLIDRLARHRLNLHAFGYKVTGLLFSAPQLASADSMAWVTRAQHEPSLPGCTHAHCNYCLPYALEWRREMHAKIENAHPGRLIHHDWSETAARSAKPLMRHTADGGAPPAAGSSPSPSPAVRPAGAKPPPSTFRSRGAAPCRSP